MSRLPITLRLTLAFAAAMAVVLAVAGLFLYLLMAHELDKAINEGLRSRTDDIAALAGRSGSELGIREEDRLTGADDSFAQIWTRDGDLLAATHEVGRRSLLTRDELDRAWQETVIVERRLIPDLEEDDLRLSATPLEVHGRRVLIVVGASLEERDEGMAKLGKLLLAGGPLALVLTSALGYALARAALRPVESMRRRAAAISADAPGTRLPVPKTRDEISRLGTTLNKMLARLELAIERERSFVADASHELRTPLAILRAELELALEHGSLEDMRAALVSAAEETDRLVALAQDLLVIASAAEGRLPVKATPNDAGELLGGVVERFRRRADAADRRLSVDVPPRLTLLADRLRVEQAIGNMIENALRHGDGPVRLQAREAHDEVELHVVDGGLGFPPSFIERAFDRFSRADTRRASGGSGLGLAVVDAIASAHGGRASARNAEGGGADVWVSLPRYDPSRNRPAPPV